MAKGNHKPLDGTHSKYFSDWDSGLKTLAPSRDKVQVKLILKSDKLLADLDIPRHLTLRQRHALFAAHVSVQEEHIARIRKFARQYKLKIDGEDKDIGIITVSGKVATVNKAFRIDLHHHHVRQEKTGRTVPVLGHEGMASVPEEIHDIVQGIIGLNCAPGSHQVPAAPQELKGVCAAKGVTSEWFANYYKFPKNFNGKGQHIAIISCGGGFDPQDFMVYFKRAGIKNPPKIKYKALDGSTNSAGTSSWTDYELYTDCLVAACAATESTITVYAVENSIFGFAKGVAYLCKLKTKRPHAISYSWGASETNYMQADIDGVNRQLQYAAQVSQISVFCSTGDYGSTNSMSNDKSTKLAVQFPASSPWITSCGGTMFELTSTGKVKKELVWNAIYLYDMLVQDASGGGFSEMNKRPAYQKKAILAKNYPRKFRTSRGVPDISAHANVTSDNICYWVYILGQNWVTGGTSAVAPLMAALTVRLNQALDKRIGFFNPLLYEMADSAAIRSISEGNNSMPNGPDAWQASQDGWDPCTGLGVPNGEAMLKWLKKNLK